MANVNVLGDWNFLDGNVQKIDDGSDFLSAESTVICAGPPDLGASIQSVRPVGLVQNAQITQNKQIQQLFEIGSRKPFFIPGRTLIQLGMSRVLFDGASLMRALYEHDELPGVTDNYNADVIPPAEPYGPATSSDFYMNLASEFFNRPLGLAFILHDGQNQKYGGFYLENCYIQTHGMSMAGQQTVLLENVGIRASNLVPLDYDESASAT